MLPYDCGNRPHGCVRGNYGVKVMLALVERASAGSAATRGRWELKVKEQRENRTTFQGAWIESFESM
jgi:hypothetical protein